MNAPGLPPPCVLVWDLPVRVLHASLALGLTVALGLGFGFDEEHPLFAYHVLAGAFAGGALVLRVIWGLVGPGEARFTRWPLAPSAATRQIARLFSGPKDEPHAGHNPLAAWVMLGIYLLAAAAVATGLAGGDDLHEGLAAALAWAVGAHLAGLIVHRWRNGENPAPAMLHGRKRVARAVSPGRPHTVVGATVALLLLTWAGMLLRGFEPATGTLRLSWGLPAVQLRSDDGHHQQPAKSRPRHHDRTDD